MWGWSTEPTPFHMIGSAPHPVRFVYDGGTSNLQTEWSPATCSLPTSFTSSFASSVLPTRAKPSSRIGLGLPAAIQKWDSSLSSRSASLGSICRELNGLDDRRIIILRLVDPRRDGPHAHQLRRKRPHQVARVEFFAKPPRVVACHPGADLWLSHLAALSTSSPAFWISIICFLRVSTCAVRPSRSTPSVMAR
jgi:hypothetical protein